MMDPVLLISIHHHVPLLPLTHKWQAFQLVPCVPSVCPNPYKMCLVPIHALAGVHSPIVFQSFAQSYVLGAAQAAVWMSGSFFSLCVVKATWHTPPGGGGSLRVAPTLCGH